MIHKKFSKIMILKPLWSASEAEKYSQGDKFYKQIADAVTKALSEWIDVKLVTAIEVSVNYIKYFELIVSLYCL